MIANKWNRHYRDFVDANPSEDLDVALAAFLSLRRRDLAGQSTFKGPDGSARAKRLARQLRSGFLKRKRGGRRARRILQRPAALLFQLKPHLLRDRLCKDFTGAWVPMRDRLKQRTCSEVTWQNLSFAKDPNCTLRQLSELSKLCATRADLRLNFDDVICDDVTPYIVFAHLRRALPPVISGGLIMPEVGDVITAVGLRGELRIGSIKSRSNAEAYDVSAFKMVSRTPPGTFGDQDHLLRPQFKEFVADRFVDTLKSWIGKHGLELKPRPEGDFVGAIGEALDNAERHGDALGGDFAEGDWSIAAFSRLMFDGEQPLLRCSVGIVSIGATISESLASAAERVQKHVDQYVALHSPLIPRASRTEALRTVMALQDGITRDADASAHHRGGVGFMELIDVIAELGDNGRPDLPSSFTIVSGTTCIRITGDYRQGMRRHGKLRELWFNPANDPGTPPSKEHVMSLDHEFPGVILSACFTIDPENLRKTVNDDDANG